MNASLIAQLIVTLGPTALDLIRQLNALWSKPSLTPAEVDALLALAEKSYDDYVNAANP